MFYFFITVLLRHKYVSQKFPEMFLAGSAVSSFCHIHTSG